MNYRKYCKVVVALVLCFALALMPFSFSVSAASSFSTGSSNRFGALIAAALTAFNITVNSINAPIGDMLHYLADPFELVYTYPEQILTDYFNQSVVKITPDKTIIDGVEYSDVWFSHNAANKLRVNAGDFSTAYSIASNTNGTFASGAGTLSGIPLYRTSPTLFRTQELLTPGEGQFVFGNVTVENYYGGSSGTTKKWRIFDGTTEKTNGSGWLDSFHLQSYTIISDIPTAFRVYWTKGSTSSYTAWPNDYIALPFDFDYISGELPLDPLPINDGLRLRVPSSSIDNFIEDYPEFTDASGHFVDTTLDPDISQKLDDLCDILAGVIPVIMYQQDMITYEGIDTPSPTYTNIADTNYSILNNTLQNIEDWLDDIYTGIQAIPSAIGNLIDGFLNDIEIGPIKVFDKALDLIQSLFAPVFLLIRNGLSIWSYVVTWFNSLASPLAFMVSVLPAAVWLPIYSVVAGTICLAIYRRFGK